jgi:acetylglutamate kinase
MAMKATKLIKVGGAELKEGPELAELVGVIARLVAEAGVIVVHGGGAEIADLQQRLGIEPHFVDGLRVTDEKSLWVAEMVLSGTVNKRLTACLVTHGVRALGLSGVDAGLLRAQRLRHPKGDLGRVGEITEVHTDYLADLLSLGFTPVISPISLGTDGQPFNVNADHAALAIASALRVDEAFFLTDVPGVLCDGAVLPELSALEAQRLIDTGTITGGMIPKVRSALRAIEGGVGAVWITNLAGLAKGSGTQVRAEGRKG